MVKAGKNGVDFLRIFSNLKDLWLTAPKMDLFNFTATRAAMVYRKVVWFCLIWGIYVKFGKEMTDFLLLIVSQTLLSTLQVQAKLQKLAKKSVNKQNAGPQQFF